MLIGKDVFLSGEEKEREERLKKLILAMWYQEVEQEKQNKEGMYCGQKKVN